MEIQEVQIVDKIYRFEGKYLSSYFAANRIGQSWTYRLYKTPKGYRVHIEGSNNELTREMSEWWARMWYPILFKKAGLVKKIDLD